jgi:hypothetical protein
VAAATGHAPWRFRGLRGWGASVIAAGAVPAVVPTAAVVVAAMVVAGLGVGAAVVVAGLEVVATVVVADVVAGRTATARA